jgi:hypothetical protein
LLQSSKVPLQEGKVRELEFGCPGCWKKVKQHLQDQADLILEPGKDRNLAGVWGCLLTRDYRELG